MPRDLGEDVGEVMVVHETEFALLCKNLDDGLVAWVPKSQVHEDSEVWEKGQEGILIVKDWFAKKIEWNEAKQR